MRCNPNKALIKGTLKVKQLIMISSSFLGFDVFIGSTSKRKTLLELLDPESISEPTEPIVQWKWHSGV